MPFSSKIRALVSIFKTRYSFQKLGAGARRGGSGEASSILEEASPLSPLCAPVPSFSF